MATFALLPVDGGKEITIADGKVTVGRGPFLRITDKRVSRHHAIIEVFGSEMKVFPIHTNPTFYKGLNGTKFESLEKDQYKELQDGDSIAFLPNDLVFKVLRREKTICITEEDDAETNSNNKEDIKNEDEELQKETDIEIPEAGCEQVCEESEVKEPAVLLKKTRNLPSWMTNKDKTLSTTPKKACQKKAKEANTCTKTSVTNREEKTDEIGGKECDENGKDEKDEADSGGKELKDTESAPKKRKRKEDDENEEEKDESDQCAKRGKVLSACPYGARCYRKNPVHFQEYSHDKQANESVEEKDDSEDESDLPECPYGTACYRKNPRHRKEYKHTATRRTPRRKVTIKKGIIDDDDDGPNDYDYDDSFINDDSESSSPDASVTTDSDWEPEAEQTGDEDVEQLVSEAKSFAKNKKMMKPS